MNKSIMFVWVLLVCSIWGVILFLGFREKDTNYIDLSNDLKSAASSYIKNKNIDLKFNESYKIFIDDLKDEGSLINDEKVKEYCVDSIVVSKGLFTNDYQIIRECNN